MYTVRNACRLINDALVASLRVNVFCELVFMRSNAFIDILSLKATNFMISNVCHNCFLCTPIYHYSLPKYAYASVCVRLYMCCMLLFFLTGCT